MYEYLLDYDYEVFSRIDHSDVGSGSAAHCAHAPGAITTAVKEGSGRAVVVAVVVATGSCKFCELRDACDCDCENRCFGGCVVICGGRGGVFARTLSTSTGLDASM